MLDKVIDGLGRVATNVWAFLLILVAGGISVVAHLGHDKDLLVFAGSVATTAGVLFSHKSNPA